MKSKGFTLIELLVVIAIIAILAAIIMPVFIQAKDSARVRTCASNLHSLGSAVMRYADDNDGCGLPLAPFRPNIPDDFSNPWTLYVKPLCPLYTGRAIKPYLRTVYNPNVRTPYKNLPNQTFSAIWLCPCDFDVHLSGRVRVDTPYNEHPCWWWFGSSYMYPGPMGYLYAENETTIMDRSLDYTPCKLLTWKEPKRDVLLADFYPDFHSGLKAPRYGPDPRSLVPDLEVKQETVNILFLDLHVKTCTADDRTQFLSYTVGVDRPFYKPSQPNPFEPHSGQ